MNLLHHPFYETDNSLPFYLRIIGGLDQQIPIDRPEGYPYFQLVYVREGSGILRVDQQEVTVTSGMCMIIPKNTGHHYEASSPTWATDFIALDGFGLEGVVASFKLNKLQVISIEEQKKHLQDLQHIYHMSLNVNKKDADMISLAIYELLIMIKKTLVKSRESNHDETRVKAERMKSYIQKHHHEDIALEAIALEAGCTKQYACKLFKSAFGQRPIEYLNAYRIKQSMQLLLNQGEMRVGDIAIKVGFRDASYFGVVFKSQVGMTPARYRLENRYS